MNCIPSLPDAPARGSGGCRAPPASAAQRAARGLWDRSLPVIPTAAGSPSLGVAHPPSKGTGSRGGGVQAAPTHGLPCRGRLSAAPLQQEPLAPCGAPSPRMRSQVPGGTPAFIPPPGRPRRRPLAGVALVDVFAGRASHPSGAMLCVFPVHRNVKYQSCLINTAGKRRTLRKEGRGEFQGSSRPREGPGSPGAG